MRKSRISPETKEKILELLAVGGRSQQSIAEEFGLRQTTVSAIKIAAAKQSDIINITDDKTNGAIATISGKTGIQAFHYKAITALDDASSWRFVEKQASIEALRMAIDVAELASAAWKDAAMHLRNITNGKKEPSK